MLKVTYLEHSIPNISLSALKENKLYYTDYNGLLFSFDFKTRVSTHIKVLKDIKISNIVIFKNNLLIFSGNKLMIYKQTEESLFYINSYLLEDIPSKIFCNKKGCIFIYGKSLEILTDKLYKIKVFIDILDICESNNIFYILTNTQDIYKCLDIFDTKDIIFSKPLIRNKKEIKMDKINYNDYTKTIILSNKTKTEKYNLEKHIMLLSYTLSYSGTLENGILCGKHAIEIGKAPFLLLADELLEYKAFNTFCIGLTKSKIYFLTKENIDSINNTKYEFFNFDKININPKFIEIPNFINTESLINKYLNLEIKIKKYDILVDKLNNLTMNFKNREDEILLMKNNLQETEKKMYHKIKLLKDRIELLEKKAIKINGDQNSINEFYKKIHNLKNLINNFNYKVYDEYKKRLLLQKHILELKLN